MLHIEQFDFNAEDITGILAREGIVFPPDSIVTIVIRHASAERLRLPLDDTEFVVVIDMPSQADDNVSIPITQIQQAGRAANSYII